MSVHLNQYWYYEPQFSREGLRIECTVHNRHTARAFTAKKAQARAEAMCDCPNGEPIIPVWSYER